MGSVWAMRPGIPASANLRCSDLSATVTPPAARPIRPAPAVYAISAVIIVLGSYWFLARIVLTA